MVNGIGHVVTVSYPSHTVFGFEVIKLFSSSAKHEISMLINVKIVKIKGKFWFKTPKLVIYHAHKF